MTNAPPPPHGGEEPAAADPVLDPVVTASDTAKAPAHRGRKIAAAVSAGAFAGIAIGLVATNVGADDDAGTVPAGQVGPPEQSGGSTGQFGDSGGGAATPAPFEGPTAPDTNSGGS